MKEPTWHLTGKLPVKKYQNYVIVLGESLRSDALSLYGNPYKTTPFLESISTISITDYVSAAVNTTLSIPRTFAISDTNDRSNVHIENNIINIAKEAGLETYWITSQRLMKWDDEGATSISLYADNRVFVPEKNDFNLLPEVDKALHTNSKRKLIVVHLWGSHEDPCKHLEGIGKVFNIGKGNFLDCYLSSVRKTDTLLNKIYDSLRKKGQSYRIVFFPDHGLNFAFVNNDYHSRRDADFKQQYEIPFIAFDSDTIVSKKFDIRQSAYNFINYFPTWIGVRTNMTPSGFDLFKREEIDPIVLKYNEKNMVNDRCQQNFQI